MEIKKEDISKIKKIYVLYSSNDAIIHCEEFPVAYANSKYIYYIQSGGDELMRVDTASVRNKLSSPDGILLIGTYVSRIGTRYYLEVENFDSQAFTAAIYKNTIEDKNREALKLIDRKTKELQDAKAEYEALKKRYNLE